MPEPKPLPRFADRIRVGEFLVSPFCLGMTEPDVVEAAFDAGINFFFISGDLHWPRYEGLREGLRRLLRRIDRKQIVICATTYLAQTKLFDVPFAEILQSIPGLGSVDILNVGGAYGDDFEPRFAALQARREAQFAGSRGLATTFHDRGLALKTLTQARVDLGFVRFNPAHPGARRDLVPLLPEARPPLFSFKSMNGYLWPDELTALGLSPDRWRPRVTDRYRYSLGEPGFAGLLFSPTTPAHLAELDEALELGPLEVEERDYMEALIRMVTPHPE